MKSPWICGILLPKPPPTSGAMTRSLSSGMPQTSDMMKRTMCRFGDDAGNGIADIGRDTFRERRVRARLQIRVRHEPRARNRLKDAFGVRARERGDDAWSALRWRRVDLANLRVAVRAAQDRSVE